MATRQHVNTLASVRYSVKSNCCEMPALSAELCAKNRFIWPIPIQGTLNREINSTVYPPGEFREKLVAGHHSLTSVLNEEKIFLIGDANELERLVEWRLTHRTLDKFKIDQRSV